MTTKMEQIRIGRDLSPHAVAKIAGMTASYYTEIESGKKSPNLRRLEAIARALNVEVTALIEDTSALAHVIKSASTPQADFDPDVIEVAKIMQGLSPQDRQALTDHAKAISGRP